MTVKPLNGSGIDDLPLRTEAQVRAGREYNMLADEYLSLARAADAGGDTEIANYARKKAAMFRERAAEIGARKPC
jgi:GrpB-like predicted nucleotidyltransferase (UPF0157 family)